MPFSLTFSSTILTNSRFLTSIATLCLAEALMAFSTTHFNSFSSFSNLTSAGSGDDAVGIIGSTKSEILSKYFDFETAIANRAISLLFL